nr:MAG TPA: hypothetical protein [Caudoviricetes sp.]DAL43981.1 MAG TPA_asm: hypothetical protein [Caudoviricetes sp.]DAP49134.1 MAG TPA: hypothetical protein [Caudoviricetes sp.]DAT46776.1 MAG TPA: hypothetical protein [Caudoviricetes sp.]DAU89668.1 MAG TPA: hypothetical protein [Caudoviricetes sp.]
MPAGGSCSSFLLIACFFDFKRLFCFNHNNIHEYHKN